MFELLSLAILIALIISGITYLVKQVIPTATLALLGGIILVAIPIALLLLPGDQTIIAVANLALLYLIVSFLVYAYKKQVPSNAAMIALSIFLILSLPLVSDEFVKLEEQSAVGAANALSPESGSIVLLGRGSTRPNFRPTPEEPGVSQIQVSASGDRVPYTAQLYRSLNPGFVIVTGGLRTPRTIDKLGDGKEEIVNEGNDIRGLLINLGVPGDRIIVESEGIRLQTVAANVNKLLNDRQLPKRIILVASAADMSIAKFIFQRQGLTVAGAPTDFQVTFADKSTRRIAASTEERVSKLLPNPEALARSIKVLGHALRAISLRFRIAAGIN
ncbi:MAG: YdcF family protein [Cyanobacteria bacterium]|nr:YdcF family protein [Cyanobacteriota bacterium]MDW8200556.1 YdcF family protein [Cyanobacteriota bacterium SKYGB_h_bin112]